MLADKLKSSVKGFGFQEEVALLKGNLLASQNNSQFTQLRTSTPIPGVNFIA